LIITLSCCRLVVDYAIIFAIRQMPLLLFSLRHLLMADIFAIHDSAAFIDACYTLRH